MLQTNSTTVESEARSPMAPGTTLFERYTIVALVSHQDGANVYRVAELHACPNCGVENEGSAGTCGFCGKALPVAPDLFLIERAAATSPSSTPWSLPLNGLHYTLTRDPIASFVEPEDSSSETNLTFAYLTDSGRVRGASGEPNEDSVFALTRALDSTSALGLFMVADGVGGADAGEVASDLAIRMIANDLLAHLVLPNSHAEPLDDATVCTAIQTAVHSANSLLMQYAHAHKLSLGTTLVLALVIGRRAYWANVGDSRAYLYRAQTLTAMTRDHSYVARLVKQGLITEEDVRIHPQRNVILRSLGSPSDYEADIYPQAGGAFMLEPEDQFLLCSDGLWEMVHEEEIVQILANASDVQEACAQLVARANAAGGADNISVVLVRVKSA